MGMQVHFKTDELEDAKVDYHFFYSPESDSWTVQIKWELSTFTVNTDNKRNSCWNDIGACSDYQMALIKFLIQNRICFNAS